jgi:hypothetical protein
MKFPKKTIAWVLLATLPLLGYLAYAIISSNTLVYQIKVTPTTVSLSKSPATSLSVGQWDNETVTVTTGSTFSGFLYVDIANQSASIDQSSNVAVYIDGLLTAPRDPTPIGCTHNCFDHVVFDSPQRQISNGATFKVAIRFQAPANWIVRLTVYEGPPF